MQNVRAGFGDRLLSGSEQGLLDAAVVPKVATPKGRILDTGGFIRSKMYKDSDEARND